MLIHVKHYQYLPVLTDITNSYANGGIHIINIVFHITLLQYYPVKYPYYCKILPHMWCQKYGRIPYPYLIRNNTGYKVLRFSVAQQVSGTLLILLIVGKKLVEVGQDQLTLDKRPSSDLTKSLTKCNSLLIPI